MKEQYFFVLDTETTGALNNPLVYDTGFGVYNRKGECQEHYSYIVKEIFFDESEKMSSAYYAEKLPQYYKGIKFGDWKVARLYTIRKKFFELYEKYNKPIICAYNLNFDKRALNNTLSYVCGERKYFFPYDAKYYDIWHMACATIFQQRTFDKLAYKNNWESAKGNVLTSAEIAYKYITRNKEYEERHTAWEDVKIEAEIMAKCFANKVKVADREVIYNPWRKPQPPYKNYKIEVASL